VLVLEDAGCQVDREIYDEIVEQAARSENRGFVVVDMERETLRTSPTFTVTLIE